MTLPKNLVFNFYPVCTRNSLRTQTYFRLSLVLAGELAVSGLYNAKYVCVCRLYHRAQRSQIWCKFQLNFKGNCNANRYCWYWLNRASWDLITHLLKDYPQASYGRLWGDDRRPKGNNRKSEAFPACEWRRANECVRLYEGAIDCASLCKLHYNLFFVFRWRHKKLKFITKHHFGFLSSSHIRKSKFPSACLFSAG